MKVDISKITSDVAALLHESLVAECEPEETLFPDLGLQVAILAPGLLQELLLQSPKSLLSGWKPLNGALTVDEEGIATLDLPDDFLLLGSVRLSGWQRSVDSLLEPEDCRCQLQESPWKGIGGTPERPVAMLGFSKGGGRQLRLFRCAQDAELEQGWYLPVPVLTAGSMEVAPSLYYQLLAKIAESVKAS